VRFRIKDNIVEWEEVRRRRKEIKILQCFGLCKATTSVPGMYFSGGFSWVFLLPAKSFPCCFAAAVELWIHYRDRRGLLRPRGLCSCETP